LFGAAVWTWKIIKLILATASVFALSIGGAGVGLGAGVGDSGANTPSANIPSISEISQPARPARVAQAGATFYSASSHQIGV
jgi:hypothetical protein